MTDIFYQQFPKPGPQSKSRATWNLKMQIQMLYSKPTESETLGVGPVMTFKQASNKLDALLL